jgi:ribosomal protein S18 acetylase RimI-like enzyme
LGLTADSARALRYARRVKAIAGDLRCMARQLGWREALSQLMDWTGYVIYRREDRFVIARTLTESPPPTRLTPDVRVEWAESRHLPVLAEFNRRHCNVRAMRRHVQVRGQRDAMLGFIGDELVGHLWWIDRRRAGDDVDLLRLGHLLNDDDVYAFEMFVAPEHRGNGTASRFLGEACEELARLGYRRIWAYVDHTNVPARWLFTTNGWHIVRRSRSWHVLSRLAVIEGKPYLTTRGTVKPLSMKRSA